jgi:alpha-mannosidase
MCKSGLTGPDNWGKEVIMKYSTDLNSGGVFYTDSNGREMMPRKTNARGPSYPPLVVHEPVAGNYYPVNSMISLDDGKSELVVVTDVSVGGASLADGELELMVHRRVQADDARGVQEPLNETMCGCNDINAAPGAMGENGHEADGGCICAGLTMRGKHFVVFDTVANAHALRRQLIETLNFPPTLAFAPAAAPFKTANATMLASALPANIKLMTLTNNYASQNDGQLLLRLAHLYSVGEHPILSQPVTLSLAAVFAKAGLKVTEGIEMSLTANREVLDLDAERRRRQWKKEGYTAGRGARAEPISADQSFRRRNRLDSSDAALPVVIGPMEIKTYLVTIV